jgi:hypothetical protein
MCGGMSENQNLSPRMYERNHRPQEAKHSDLGIKFAISMRDVKGKKQVKCMVLLLKS